MGIIIKYNFAFYNYETRGVIFSGEKYHDWNEWPQGRNKHKHWWLLQKKTEKFASFNIQQRFCSTISELMFKLKIMI